MECLNKYHRISIVILFLVLFAAYSCSGAAKQKLNIKSQTKPNTKHHSPLSYSANNQSKPDRIILNLTDKPTESQAVTWRTKGEVSIPQAQIAPASEICDFNETARTINGKSESVEISRKKIVYYHNVVFTSLMPNTLYIYRVGDGKHWSEWNQFRTAGKNDEPFKFIYFGDPQNRIKSLCSRIFREAYKTAPDSDFWLFVGDTVNNGSNDAEWSELFYAIGWIPRMTPIILLPGNHEYANKRFHKGKDFKLSPLWRPQFTFPENGPESLEETVYYIDYHNVRIVMLNGNEKFEEQAKWLDNILSRNPQFWTIIAIHQPLYSTGLYRENSYLQDVFVPIIDKYAVDLVLQGHDHTYSRSYKIKNGVKVKGSEKGTVYIVSVSGPKAYPINPRYEKIMEILKPGRQFFQVVSVDKNRLKYESFNAIGERCDYLELVK